MHRCKQSRPRSQQGQKLCNQLADTARASGRREVYDGQRGFSSQTVRLRSKLLQPCRTVAVSETLLQHRGHRHVPADC